MIDELIDSIGMEKILYEIENNIDLGNSTYFRIYENKSFSLEDDVLITKTKEENIPNLNLYKWFKNREFYINKLDGANKEIVTKGNSIKLIQSNQPLAINFKFKTFLNDLEKKEGILNKTDLKSLITVKDVLIKFLNEYIKVFLETYNTRIHEINIEQYYRIYNNNIKNIIDFIVDNNKSEWIKIIIDNKIQTYKEFQLYYLEKKGVQEVIENKSEYYVPVFLNLNKDKPLLKNINNTLTENIRIFDKNEILQLTYLKAYLNINRLSNINTKIGTIKYVMEWDESVKEFKLNDYKNIPCVKLNILQNKYLAIENVLGINKLECYQLRSNEELINYINKLLNFNLFKKLKSDNKLKAFQYRYKTILKNFGIQDINIFKNNLNKMCNDLFKIHTNSDDILKKCNILNFNINVKSYFLNNGLKGEILLIKEKVRNKIANLNFQYKIDDDNEFLYLCGQMANCFKRNSATVNLTCRLLREYERAKDVDKIISLLARDKSKLDYDSGLSSRTNLIIEAICLYKAEHKNIKINEFYLAGLYGENIVRFTKTLKNKSEVISNETGK